MQIRITEKTDVTDKGKYKEALVKYSQDGQDKEKKVMSFAQKETYNTLVAAAPGEVYEIKTVKDGKFWNWESATLCSPGAAVAPSGGTSGGSKGNWETAEERAMRQVWIIRQSSIASACNLYCTDAPDAENLIDLVLEAAKRFEAYVHGVQEEVEPDIT
jgi:hypothetical protein